MATIRLIPSAYSRSSTSRVTVTDPTNMYYNTDHTANYCSIRGRNSSSYTYYAFIHGFNFDDVPSNVQVTSFTIKIRCYKNSYLQQGTSYRPRLASSTSNDNVISDTTLEYDVTTTAGGTVYTFPIPSTLTWSILKGYGSNFSIEVPLRSSSSSYPYLYVYGAEIEVTYSLPVYHTVTSSTTVGTISPSGATSVLEGDSYTLTISGANSPTATDNGVNVTSQLVQQSSGTATLIPYDSEYTGFSTSNISNAYTDATSTTSAQLNLAARTTGNLYLDLGGATIPSSATIQSVSCTATLQFSRNNSSSSVTASFQLYTGSTAKGSSTSWISSATDVSKTTYTLTTGTWTAAEIANARFYLTAYNGASGTQRIFYVYGVSFNVTYEFDGVVYTYTITNVTGDHIIVISGGSTPTVTWYKKVNGSWVSQGIVAKVYKKINGSWVEQSDIASAISSSTNYVVVQN